MAPEILNYLNDQDSNDQYTNSVDIWALGCIVYRLITGTVPFPPGKSLIKYCEDKSLFPYDALFDSGIKSEGSRFLRQLLITQPTDRPAASQALRHPWILSGEQRISTTLQAHLAKEFQLRPYLQKEFFRSANSHSGGIERVYRSESFGKWLRYQNPRRTQINCFVFYITAYPLRGPDTTRAKHLDNHKKKTHGNSFVRDDGKTNQGDKCSSSET